MARSHSTEPDGYTNPEVRFERSDVEYRGVVLFGVILSTCVALVVPAMLWLGHVLLNLEKPRKVTDLPPAAVDADQLPPEPRLEALDELRERKARLYPPRAEEYLDAQKKLLADGDPKKGIEEVSLAIEALAGRLPVREGAAEAPVSFSRRLPSKAASGRKFTGGS